MIKSLKKKLKSRIIKKKLSKKNIYIGNEVNFKNPEDLNENISVGDLSNIRRSEIGSYTYIGKNCYLPWTKIGKFCSIGNNIKAMLQDHPVDLISTHPIFYKSRHETHVGRYLFDEDQDVNLKKGVDEDFKIVIGNDVWIGDDVVIMPGVEIGDGAIVGTGAIVTKSVKPYSVVVGIPAKVIKYRFSEERIEYLLRLKWWDKDFKWIEENKNNFLNVEDFFKVKEI